MKLNIYLLSTMCVFPVTLRDPKVYVCHTAHTHTRAEGTGIAVAEDER